MDSLDFMASLLKMLFALALVIGLMIGAVYIFRKTINTTGGAIDNGKFIKIISARYLGPKCSIMLVDVLNHVVVIGLANNQITVLTTISDPASLEKLKNAENEKTHQVSLLDHIAACRSKLLAAGKSVQRLNNND